jgi:anti-sigma-K factor RskA
VSDRNGSRDGLGRIETLLAELEVGDLHLPSPPPEVWAAVEQAIDADRRDPAESIRPRRTRGWMLAAAAAVVALAVVASAVILRDDAAEEVVSTAVLVHDPAAFDPRGAEASATAELVERKGSYAIRLSGQGLSAAGGADDLELWLIEPDATGRPADVAPVGLLRGDGAGVYVVPETVDPRSHYVVDISIEPRDGDPAHSGDSILRGALDPG